MRFDYRGMGDSSGDDRTFETVAADIGEAIDALLEQIHQLDRIVLWGLCDGASAICLYAPQDKRVAGLVLANPWVRTERGEATTYLKHYYLGRLFQLSFWRKATSGNLDALNSITALTRTVRTALTRKHKETVGHREGELPGRMAESLRQARLPVLYLLSKRDYVAAEFEELTSADKDWNALVSGAQLERFEADHTFSTGVLREAVAGATAAWVSQVGATLANIDAKILLRATT
jgi:exosortase A-associated hydrolase 1